MVQEREGKQHPIYFISKVLQDVERRYQKIKKATLALVIASRRLCPYFQEHSIIVRTNLPIKGHIKAQALADFLIEMMMENPETEAKNRWFLSVDGASNQIESGARVILEGSNGVLIKQSLHFEFKASNN
ncbi:hypothetical protein CR513_47677, partial [Mucuna pruriens]